VSKIDSGGLMNEKMIISNINEEEWIMDRSGKYIKNPNWLIHS